MLLVLLLLFFSLNVQGKASPDGFSLQYVTLNSPTRHLGAEMKPFLNCTKGDPDSPVRRCCASDDLPYGCECFDVSPSSYFQNSWQTLPQCPDEIPVTFTLFNRQYPNGTSLSVTSLLTDGQPAVFLNLKTHFLVHGYTDSATDGWIRALRVQLLQTHDCHVVTVDWAPGARPPYRQAVANLRTAAAATAALIHAMWRRGAPLNDVHLIGHSLGAHLMGLAGQEVQRMCGRPVGRVTGLDPAGPRFWTDNPIVILDRTDAMFVDVIHTNGRMMGEGISRSTGHADFWPDGGASMPGCALWDSSCSHHRAHELFHSSVLGVCDFLGRRADGAACRMGYHCDPACRGVYELTAYPARFPFC